jgi:hypothetical protein
MAMFPGDVWKVHAALAHQLLDTWPVCQKDHQIVQSELEDWSLRAENNAEKYLRLLIGRLQSAGVEQCVLDALDGVQDELEHVDEHLRSMFETALGLTRDCYQLWADWSAASVDLKCAPATNPVYPDRAGFGELGVVACVPPREEPGAPAIVKLTFIPGLLGPPSWASVPYLLCHELICHVNQAGPMSSEDSFGEGWMDLVALQLHNHWAGKIFPWAPALARTAGARLSDDVLRRWRGLPEPHMTTRAVRDRGRAAAQWVEDALEKLTRTDQGSEPSEMVRLSLQLNRASPTLAGRIEFISKVNDRSNWRRQAGLLAELRRWLWDTEEVDRVLSFT